MRTKETVGDEVNAFRRDFAPFVLPFLLLLFPTLCVVFAAAGFLVGQSVGKWQGVLALALTLFAGCALPTSGQSRLTVLSAFMGVGVLAVSLTSLFVLYSDPDVEWYHRPAMHLLANGWNPVFDATPAQVDALHLPAATTFSARHVAYLPRASWIWGAVFYKLVGFAEAGDAVNLMFAVALALLLWHAVGALYSLTKSAKVFFVAMIVVSPEVVNCLVGGMNDGLFYIALLVVFLSALMLLKRGQGTWIPLFVVGMIWLCNVKFTGVVCAAIGIAVISVCHVMAAVRQRCAAALKRWWWTVVAAGTIALLVGFSPYITNWVHYGSPFYPQHTFNKSVKLDSITCDFDVKNADAARMGYVGRQVYAYVSKTAATCYYRATVSTGSFAPVFEVSATGFGPVFRFVFVVSLGLWLLRLRRSVATPLLVALLVCALAQPTTYVGYGRYVSFLVVVPTWILLEGYADADRSARRRWVRTVSIGAALVLWGSVCVACPTRLVFKWYAATQNLALVDAAHADPESKVVTPKYCMYWGLGDWGIQPITTLDPAGLGTEWQRCRAGRAPFVLYTRHFPINGYVPFDMEAAKPRQGSFAMFFVRNYMLGSVMRSPAFVIRVIRWRVQQLRSAWSARPDHGDTCLLGT